MWTWLSRMFRSSGAAERAEAEGRIDDAARLYVEAGDRDEAVRVLVRAGETARTLDERREYLTRAHGLARSEAQRAATLRGIALVSLAEAEASAPQTPEEQRRLAEAAARLESLGAFKEAARAFSILDDREAMVRVLTLSGDVDGLERETGAVEFEERLGLRRRAAMESFEVLWRSGDRAKALADMARWVEGHGDDHEARKTLDQRSAQRVTAGLCEVEIDGDRRVLVCRDSVVLGREGDIVVRGGSVSRRHCRLDRRGEGFTVCDAGSRAGTQLDGISIAEPIALVAGRSLQLGADVSLKVHDAGDGCWELEIDRGMDRGRRVMLLTAAWRSPFGPVTFSSFGPGLDPAQPVSLNGQRVAVPFGLVKGDRVEAMGKVLVVVG